MGEMVHLQFILLILHSIIYTYLSRTKCVVPKNLENINKTNIYYIL
jgi:hypothetical protein